jgi:hypothetical protein
MKPNAAPELPQIAHEEVGIHDSTRSACLMFCHVGHSKEENDINGVLRDGSNEDDFSKMYNKLPQNPDPRKSSHDLKKPRSKRRADGIIDDQFENQ